MKKTEITEIKDKKILVVGFGRSGIAAARVLLDLGACVAIQDSKKEEDIDEELLASFRRRGAEFYLGKIPEDLGQFAMLVLSPGVTPELDFVQRAKASGAEIIGELELAWRIGDGTYIAITGTNGKTTTTTLVGEIFKKAGRITHVVGNIGTAVISAAENAKSSDWLVTECSSFQLETTRYFKPLVSAILNLTPDHLDRHHTMEAYGAAKAKVFQNQKEEDYLVINKDDPVCFDLAKGCRARIISFSMKEELETGAFVRGNQVIIADGEGKLIPIVSLDKIQIIGDHNVMNVLAASAISYFSGISPEIIGAAVAEFRGVPHRIEYCGTINGVRYYNDSKGTNTDAAVTAIKALKKRIILIAGGDAKGQNFDDFLKEFPGKVKFMILLGRDAEEIQKAADASGFSDYVFCKDMKECVQTAYEKAEEGDTVLLSPACASWDMYDNYEQRGDDFKRRVSELSE